MQTTIFKSLNRTDKEPISVDLDIKEVTLLSVEEAVEYLTPRQRNLGVAWWLRPGASEPPSRYTSSCMSSDGDPEFSEIYNCGVGVSPALKIDNLKDLGLLEGDKFMAGGELWTIISDDLAWCARIIRNECFRVDYQAPDAQSWEKSDVKTYLNNWAFEKGIVTQENVQLFEMR